MKFKDNKTLDYFMGNQPIKLKIPQVKKIIAVASAKGGVGKSTIASNLAVLMANKGKKIALVDADIYGPSISFLMNVDQKPQIKNNLFVPVVNYGVKIMSIAMILQNGIAGIWRGPMINKILNQLLRTVDWSFDNNEIDCMIVDMPPGTGDIYLSLAQNFEIDGVLLVSTPHNLSIIDNERSIDCFNKLDIKILGLIQNMSYLAIDQKKHYLFGKDGVKKLAKDHNINFLGELPILEKINQLSEERQLIANFDCEFTRNLDKISCDL